MLLVSKGFSKDFVSFFLRTTLVLFPLLVVFTKDTPLEGFSSGCLRLMFTLAGSDEEVVLIYYSKDNGVEHKRNMMSEDTESVPCKWSDDIEKVVKHIQCSCSKRRILHMEMAIEYQNKFSSLMMTNIVLGPLAGLISTISLTVETSVTEMTIVSSCLGFLAGTVAAITKFSKYDESSSTHKGASIKFSALEANIKRQLALPESARSKPDEYLTFVDSSYESLVSSAPLTAFIVDDCIDKSSPSDTIIELASNDSDAVKDTPPSTEIVPEPRLEYELNRMFNRK